MFRAGMTGVRLNLSHTGLADCAHLLKDIYWPAAREAGVEAHLIIDLQGPELRVGKMENAMAFPEGQLVVLGRGGVPVPQTILDYAEVGHEISLDDSALLIRVEEHGGDHLVCRVLRGGVLKSRKSLSILGVQPDTPTLTQEDLANLDLAGEMGVTHILQPFVRGKKDLDTLRAELDKRGLHHVRIMSKIENAVGLANLDEIIAHTDELCIARGDLGNSMPLWELPRVQKDIAARCVKAGREFCLVTQLLWSMENRAVPTRAEVLDIYNGVLDGCSSLMLTGETAVGKYPVQAMEYLVKTANTAL
jgi:pyruvate kinase